MRLVVPPAQLGDAHLAQLHVDHDHAGRGVGVHDAPDAHGAAEPPPLVAGELDVLNLAVEDARKPELERARPLGHVVHVQVLAAKGHPLVARAAARGPDQPQVDAVADGRARAVDVAHLRRPLHGHEHGGGVGERLVVPHARLQLGVHFVLRAEQHAVDAPLAVVAPLRRELGVDRGDARERVGAKLGHGREAPVAVVLGAHKHWVADIAQPRGVAHDARVGELDVGLLDRGGRGRDGGKALGVGLGLGGRRQDLGVGRPAQVGVELGDERGPLVGRGGRGLKVALAREGGGHVRAKLLVNNHHLPTHAHSLARRANSALHGSSVQGARRLAVLGRRARQGRRVAHRPRRADPRARGLVEQRVEAGRLLVEVDVHDGQRAVVQVLGGARRARPRAPPPLDLVVHQRRQPQGAGRLVEGRHRGGGQQRAHALLLANGVASQEGHRARLVNGTARTPQY